MIDHKVLNLFNHLFISGIRIETGEGWSRICFNNSIRNHLIPLLLGVLTSFVGASITARNFHYILQHVTSLSSILRYATIMQVNIIINTFSFLQRKKCAIMTKKFLRFDRYYCKTTNTWDIKTVVKFTRKQIVFAIISYLVITMVYIIIFITYAYGLYTKILHICCIFIGFHFALQLLYAVFFVEHLTIRYRLIRALIQKHTGQKLMRETLKLYDLLKSIQIVIADVFGLYCLMYSLVVFLNSSIAIYCGIILLDQNMALLVPLGEAGNIVPTIVLFYGMTYIFDVLIHEEQEFKRAVTSHQYNSFNNRSESDLSFLDQINLKLMTESPKISACGLFTINLQVLNNVFAAIVTYIVILFQFRSFEKT